MVQAAKSAFRQAEGNLIPTGDAAAPSPVVYARALLPLSAMKMVPSPLLILLQSRLLRLPITLRSRLPNLLSARLEETLSQLEMLQLLLLWSMPGLQELVSARVLLPLSAMKMVPSPLLILLQSRLLRLPITLRSRLPNLLS